MLMRKIKQSIHNKKNQVYPGLEPASYSMHILKTIVSFHFVWFLLGAIGFKYHSFMFMFDAVMILVSIIHVNYVIPQIIKGGLKAYYRISYEKFAWLFILRDVLVLGAYIRLFGYVFLSKGLQLVTDTNIEELKEHIVSRMGLNAGVIIGIVVYVLYVYFMYFQQKGIPAGEYNKRVFQMVKGEHLPLQQAAVIVANQMLQPIMQQQANKQALKKQQTPYDFVGMPKEKDVVVKDTKQSGEGVRTHDSTITIKDINTAFDTVIKDKTASKTSAVVESEASSKVTKSVDDSGKQIGRKQRVF